MPYLRASAKAPQTSDIGRDQDVAGCGIKGSLRRLKRDQVDLYQMHWPAEDGTPLEEYWQCLLDLKKAGKARAVGQSNRNVEQLQRAQAIGHVAANVP
jgi:aryl-alcohol dehydrogenase-like predicted oxidoreductase